MPDIDEIVINTSPIVALVAATGDLRVLRRYRQVCVPLEVCHEVAAGGAGQFALTEFQQANWLHKSATPIVLSTMLGNTLDLGEASVIQIIFVSLPAGIQKFNWYSQFGSGNVWTEVLRSKRMKMECLPV